MSWIGYSSIVILVLVALSQLISNWKTEKRKRAAGTAMLLLMALALLPAYSHFALKLLPPKNANYFVIALTLVAVLESFFGWMLSISGLVAAIVWRRSSKHARSSWALGAAIWASLLWTLYLLGDALAA